MQPMRFSWVDKPHVAGFARPESADELAWLRDQGIQLVVTLTEDPLPRSWVNDAGLFSLHVPILDLHPPTQAQIDLVVGAIERAKTQGIGAGVHCFAGIGRTGTLLACWLVKQRQGATAAVDRIRTLRPGSIETDEQFDAVAEYARRIAKS